MSRNYTQTNIYQSHKLDINLSSQPVWGTITDSDRYHIYTINLQHRSHLSLFLDNSLGNNDLEVFDTQGNMVGSSHNRGSRNEFIDQTLAPGEYQVHVKGVGFRNNIYKLTLSQSPIQSPTVLESYPYKWDGLFADWEFTQEIQTRIQDGKFDRQDAIAIFQLVMDGGIVDGVEFADLQNLVKVADELNIIESVQVLANKVINGDIANQYYQGQLLGNLGIGSDASQLQQLANKWFFGTDRPATTSTYEFASGQLFQNGISYTDIRQGDTNDCYFLAGLALVAKNAPEIIANMFNDNGDGTYTVKFWHKGNPEYITVDRYLPVDSFSQLVYASKGENISNPENELWVALAEKAYAQLNASGWLNQKLGNSYSNIGQNGYISDALQHITGQLVSLGNILDFEQILAAIDGGLSVGMATKGNITNNNLIANHAYALINYDATEGIFELFNPWGINTSEVKLGLVNLSWQEILANFSYWDANKLST